MPAVVVNNRHERVPSTSSVSGGARIAVTNDLNTVLALGSTLTGSRSSPLPEHPYYISSTASAGLDSGSELSELTDEDQEDPARTVTRKIIHPVIGRGSGRAAARGTGRGKVASTPGILSFGDSDKDSISNNASNSRSNASNSNLSPNALHSPGSMLPPAPAPRKKRSSIVPAPMWGWASAKPVSSSSSTGPGASSSGNPNASNSSRTSSKKAAEEEEEEEFSGPSRAFEEEEEEDDHGKHGDLGNIHDSASVHGNGGSRKARKGKDDKSNANHDGHGPASSSSASSSIVNPTFDPTLLGMGKRKGAIAAAEAIKRLSAAAAASNAFDDEEDATSTQDNSGTSIDDATTVRDQENRDSAEGAHEGKRKKNTANHASVNAPSSRTVGGGNTSKRRSPKGARTQSDANSPPRGRSPLNGIVGDSGEITFPVYFFF